MKQQSGSHRTLNFGNPRGTVTAYPKHRLLLHLMILRNINNATYGPALVLNIERNLGREVPQRIYRFAFSNS